MTATEHSANDSPEIEPIQLKASGLTFNGFACGEGPVVLCLHGFPDNARSFRYQLPALAKAGYRAIAPTMRGYEPSAQPSDGDYTLEAIAGDVIGWIDYLGEDKVHLLGHDWGAITSYVACNMAPQRFNSLATIAVPGGRMDIGIEKVPEQRRKSWYMMFFQLRVIADIAVQYNDWALIKRLWRDWSPGYDLPAEEWNSLRQTFSAPGVKKGMLAYYRQNASLSILLGGKKAGVNADRGAIPVRTLAITGENDGCVDTRLYDHVFFDEDFPEGVRVERIKNAGHFAHQEKPDEINSLLLNWLSP
jgi:pimeloyl-ACP methyl ester carboxylesterase